MATGESITPTTDIIMKSTRAGTPAIGASIDPTNYYGQSFVYDEWVKSKLKEMGEDKTSDIYKEQQALKKSAADVLAQQQQLEKQKQAIIDKHELDTKKEMESLDKVVTEKVAKYDTEHWNELHPGLYDKKLREEKVAYDKAKNTVMSKVMADKEIRAALGYDPVTGAKYGSVEIDEPYIMKLIQEKYPEAIKYIKETHPYGEAAHFVPAYQSGVESGLGEDVERTLATTRYIPTAGNIATPSHQLAAYNRDIMEQKAVVKSILDDMKSATTKEELNTAQKKYDTAIAKLKDVVKTDIDKIAVWVQPKYAQGYGEGGKLSAGEYGEAANIKYKLEQDIKAPKAPTDENIVATNIAAQQLAEVNARINAIDLINKYRASPTSENEELYKKAIEDYSSIANTNQILAANYAMISAPAITATLPKDAISTGSIGGSKIYNLAGVGEVVMGRDNKLVRLSDVTTLLQRQHGTGEYTPYGAYSPSKILGYIKNEKNEDVPVTIADYGLEKLTTSESGLAALELNKILESPNVIDMFAGAKLAVAGYTREGLPIVNYNRKDFVVPKFGLPIALSDYNKLSDDQKMVKSKSPSDVFLLPTAPQAFKDIVNVGVKYGGLADPDAFGARLELFEKLNPNVGSLTKESVGESDYNKYINEVGRGIATGVSKEEDVSTTKITDVVKVRPFSTMNILLPDTQFNYDTAGNPISYSADAGGYPVSVDINKFATQDLVSNFTQESPKVDKVSKVDKSKASYYTPSGNMTLEKVTVNVGNLSNVKTPSQTFDFGNLLGNLSNKSKSESLYRKTKSKKPKLNIKKEKSIKSSKGIIDIKSFANISLQPVKSQSKKNDSININTKIKSEIPEINVMGMNFIRGKTANNRVGVIDTTIVKGKDMFKISLPSFNTKKKKVK